MLCLPCELIAERYTAVNWKNFVACVSCHMITRDNRGTGTRRMRREQGAQLYGSYLNDIMDQKADYLVLICVTVMSGNRL